MAWAKTRARARVMFNQSFYFSLVYRIKTLCTINTYMCGRGRGKETDPFTHDYGLRSPQWFEGGVPGLKEESLV